MAGSGHQTPHASAQAGSYLSGWTGWWVQQEGARAGRVSGSDADGRHNSMRFTRRATGRRLPRTAAHRSKRQPMRAHGHEHIHMQRGGAGWAGAVARVRHRGGRNGNAAGSQRGATPGAESPRQHRHSGPHKHKRKPGHAHAPSNADIARARRCYVASAATATRPRTAAHVSKSRRPPRTLVRTMACAPETADRYAAVPHAALVAPSRCTHAVVAGKRARGLRLAAAHGGDGLNDTLACLSRGRLFNLMELIPAFGRQTHFFFAGCCCHPPSSRGCVAAAVLAWYPSHSGLKQVRGRESLCVFVSSPRRLCAWL